MSHRDAESSWQRSSNTIHTGDPLAKIYNEGTWRLSKVSPLYNLQYNTVKLKQYSSKIRQGLVSAVTANSSIKYSVQIEEQVILRYSEDDATGLLITVTISSQNWNKTVYTAILLSWGVSTSLENATHLPYMLERGEQKVGTSVRATIQTIFDCNIKQFSFTQQQLLHLGFNLVEIDSSRDTDNFNLLYRLTQTDPKDKLNVAFEMVDMKIIWRRISNNEMKKSDQVTVAYQILQNQIFYSMMLDITVFHLCEVALPKAEVQNNGVVKMKTPEVVNCVLSFLNEISDVSYQESQDSSLQNDSLSSASGSGTLMES